MSDLKQCPFCGGEADVTLSQSRYGQFYAIHHDAVGNCPASYVNSMHFATEAEAIAAWNSRAEQTCRNDSIKRDCGVFICSECGVYLDIADMSWDGEDDSGGFYEPDYCPNCGAQVMDE